MTRYTIEFSIKAIDEEGDDEGPEVEGITMDWATTNLTVLSKIMHQCYEDADSQLWDWDDDADENITPRRPAEEDDAPVYPLNYREYYTPGELTND